jgi:hypothetical protein
MSLLLTEFAKVAQSEVIFVQGTIHNAVTPFYKLTVG